jgi:hypothetical protein
MFVGLSMFTLFIQCSYRESKKSSKSLSSLSTMDDVPIVDVPMSCSLLASSLLLLVSSLCGFGCIGTLSACFIPFESEGSTCNTLPFASSVPFNFLLLYYIIRLVRTFTRWGKANIVKRPLCNKILKTIRNK